MRTAISFLLAVTFTGQAWAQPSFGEHGSAGFHAVVNFTELAGGERLTSVAIDSASPVASKSFSALPDNNTSVPPDTNGAVGPNHVVTMLNTQIRVQTRTGTTVSTVSLDSFWAALNPNETFDPHIVYDPSNDRWIASSLADSDASTSSILIGVSGTGDPRGDWNLYRVDVDPGNTLTADYDTLGFNDKWIVVAMNMFKIGGTYTGRVQIYAFDKADLYANGAGNYTLLRENSGNAYTMVPCVTYDSSLATMYLIEDWDGTQGKLRLSSITGPVGNEILNPGIAFPSTTNRWDYGGTGDFAPQYGIDRKIDAGDSSILNAVYRNGAIWCTQTAFLPVSSPNRCAAQWWEISTTGIVAQFGRMDDPTGGQFYAYPSIAVNSIGDVLLGYTRFSAAQYASANYAYHDNTDPPGSLRDDTVLKAGEGPYYRTNGGAYNRWGDYSATVVDPVDDFSFWTLQEYAATQVGTPANDGAGRWGTWWGLIYSDLSVTGLTVQIVQPAVGMSYPPGATVSITATAADTVATTSNITFYADGNLIGTATRAPYQITWQPGLSSAHSLVAKLNDTLGNQRNSLSVTITTGDAKSPLGTWQTTLGGFDRGLAYLTFADDFSLQGYGITSESFGLISITGTWGFDAKHGLTGTYTETIADRTNFTSTITGKATARRGLRLRGQNVDRRSLKGKPAESIADPTGLWLTTTGSFSIAASPALFGLFDITSATVSGQMILNSRDAVSAFIVGSNSTASAVSGKLNPTKGTLKLSGQNISINATHTGP